MNATQNVVLAVIAAAALGMVSIFLADHAQNRKVEPTRNGTLLGIKPDATPLKTYGHNGQVDFAEYCFQGKVVAVSRSGQFLYAEEEDGTIKRCPGYGFKRN